MMCRNPFTRGLAAYPCGRCLPCLFNRRRMWSHRIMLETLNHSDNAFVTLTYADDPFSVNPKHLQDFFKRLRKAIEPSRIRYYAVGEYGDQSWRPHYHIALFGYPACSKGRTEYRRDGKSVRCCRHCDLIHSSWSFGRIDVAELNINSAQYVAGYVTKKMTRTDDYRLEGRWPEFARMSLRPGLGLDAMWDVADVLMKFNLDTSQADVPSALRHGTRMLPLGRYLRRKLRLMIGKEEKTPDEVIRQAAKEMLPMLQAAIADPEMPSFKCQVIKAGDGKAARAVALSKIRKQRKSL